MREPTEMELRVAKAIQDCVYVDGADDFRYAPTVEGVYEAARAAIRAMREPTPEVAAVLEHGKPNRFRVWGADYWRDGIDAASPPIER